MPVSRAEAWEMNNWKMVSSIPLYRFYDTLLGQSGDRTAVHMYPSRRGCGECRTRNGLGLPFGLECLDQKAGVRFAKDDHSNTWGTNHRSTRSSESYRKDADARGVCVARRIC